MILDIPDTHCYHGDNPARFGYLSKFIADIQPDTVIFKGDWFDMYSINRFNKIGSIKREGERICLDIDAGAQALHTTWNGVSRLNARRRMYKEKQYKPRVIFMLGNHEERLVTFIDENPMLEGVPGLDIPQVISSIRDIPEMEVIAYRKWVEVDDIVFTHIPFNGGRPISGRVNTCGDALKLVDKSSSFSHTHRLEFKQFTRMPSQKLISAFNSGCFIDDPYPEYMIDSNPNWWQGVSLLFPENGNFNITTHSLVSLRKRYG